MSVLLYGCMSYPYGDNSASIVVYTIVVIVNVTVSLVLNYIQKVEYTGGKEREEKHVILNHYVFYALP